MNRIVEEQLRRNRERLAAESTNDVHRKHVTSLLVPAAASQSPSLCVLGVGYGTDLDVNQLTVRFRQVHLVDVDAEAIAATAARFRQADAACDVHEVCCDVSGLYSHLESPTPPGRLLPRLQQHLQSGLPSTPWLVDGQATTFDCVASTCLLSQLIEAVHLALGESPELPALLLTLRHCHLKMMINALRPGGLGVLITDFVSSQTLPALLSVSDAELPACIRQAIEQQNFFTGCNPLAIRAELTSPGRFPHRIVSVQISRPWRWSLGSKLMAVAAIVFRVVHD